jgi:hypothetical protein
MEDAITVGVPQSVVLASLAVLKFVDRRLSAIVAVMIIAGTVACSEYLIAIPVIGIMGLSALAWLYELLVKLEKRWDRALARRYRKLREVPPWQSGDVSCFVQARQGGRMPQL